MPLTAAQLARMSPLLDEVLPLDEAARRRWLEALPSGNEDLAPALWSLLLPEPGAIGGVDELAIWSESDTDAESDSVAVSGLQPGARIGPYELIRLLGTGGMAEVWLARRADGAFKREVALKLPLLTRLRKDLEQRFIRERDILASLEHPRIARLYDAGIDPQGLPYLAMEYVQGQPLISWCDEKRLGIPDRLALILQVLDAVQYAHEKHIIHRDLKPSNILVTGSGQVRLLDFGVALLLQDETAAQQQITSVYGRALTPDYASPEWLRGDAVDARSNVYSLGVLLYELLTGIRPYRLKRMTSVESLERAIATIDVQRPSTQCDPEAIAARLSTPEKLTRELRGDLDAITLRALAKEPADRYAGAAGMAEDLKRYLRGEPVQARLPPVLYRVGKFLRRNRAPIWLAAVSVFIILVAVGVDHLMLSERVGDASPSYSKPPARSLAVLPFVNMSLDREQDYFSDGLTEEMIDLLGRVPDLRVPARTSSFYFKGKNEAIASIAQQLKVAYLLEGSVRKAPGQRLRISARLIRADNGYQLWSQIYDRSNTDVFAVQDDIARSVVSALQVKLSAGAQETGSRGTTDIDAYNEYLLGRQLSRRGNLEAYLRSVEAYSHAIVLDPDYAAAYAGLALAEAALADFTGDAGGIERAGHDVDKAIALAPTDAMGYAARSFIRTTWLWDWTGSQADIEKALRLDPRSSDVQHRYAQFLTPLGRLPEAIAAQKKATELDPLSSNAWETLGFYYTNIGDYEHAELALVRAMKIEPTSVFALNNLGTLRLLQAKGQEALEAFRRVDHQGFRLSGIAMTEHTLGDKRGSQQALDELMAKRAKEDADEIAEVYAWRGEKDRAFEWLERAYRQRDGGLSTIKTDPTLASLRADPRFDALLRKMKLPVRDDGPG